MMVGDVMIIIKFVYKNCVIFYYGGYMVVFDRWYEVLVVW